MEKLKNLITKLLPHAASAVTFLSPPPSPRKTPPTLVVSLIPAEARRKPKYGSSFDTREPSSPKVSCLGQVNNNKNKKPKTKNVCPPPQQEKSTKPHGSLIVKIFKGTRKGGKNDSVKDNKEAVVDKVPSLGLMKRFESGRGGVLSDFEWTAHVTVLGPDCQGCSVDDEERQGNGESENVIIPIKVNNGNLGVQSKK